MDTNRLKRFATEARNKIRQGVVNKLLTLGFNAAGEADEFPRQLQGSTLFRGQQLEESFYDQWIALYEAIQKQGVKEVYEEVAYTWFNRFMAIRILQMNGFIDRVLVFDNPDIRVPHIVTEARQGRFPVLTTSEQLRLRNIITDPTKTYEQFVILITAFCHTTPILNQCFGSINDYTELLLPNDILEEGGFVDMLNHTEFITEEDYKTTELLGWLYQFYISERKDEVFASFKKGKKAAAEDIAPATQIFTPNWIVKYMVENTLGRIYLDNNPDSDLRNQMSYLVEQAEGNEAVVYDYVQLEELRVIDPACGSGHILLEAFDLLYAMYLDEFYSREEAITAIFAYNLVGIDLDTRARQLATFALLLKACQRDDSFLDAHCMPLVFDMSRVVPAMTEEELDNACLSFMGYEDEAGEMLAGDFEQLSNAQTLGSIMQFNNDAGYLAVLRNSYEEYLEEGFENCSEEIQALIPGVEVILALTDQYAAVIANPPYMGAGNMNKVLSDYVKEYYPEAKSDLFSVFMQVAESLLDENGKYGMINMQSWMFLSSFEKLRTHVLSHLHIDSMLHLGPRTFDELSGEVVQNTAFVISKHEPLEEGGTYYRLIEGNNCCEKEALFLSHRCGNEDGNRIYYPNVSQKNFEKIPGCPIGYWVSDSVLNAFETNHFISDLSEPRVGMATANNDIFIRLWHEVCLDRTCFNSPNRQFAKESQKIWFPFTKGGEKRYWYGNHEYLVNWYNDGSEIRNYKDKNTGRIRSHNYNLDFIFQPAITWGTIASGKPSFRSVPEGFLYSNSGYGMFFENKEFINTILGLLNSKVSTLFLNLLSPGIGIESGYIRKVPCLNQLNETIDIVVQSNISISRSDWDAHETSWDFQRNELLTIDEATYADNIQYQIEQHEKETGEKICIDPAAPKLGSLAWRLEQYKLKWEKRFMQLHANEEELNRQFIDIYGLQDELTPDVPLNEVTILQQGEITLIPAPGSSNGEPFSIEWNDAVLVKQFISYAIGCMMGRYSLDKPGLILANQGDTMKEYLEQVPSPSFMPDEDGILPLMDENSPFPDNVVTRLAEWVKVALGAEWQTANLNCMETALGKSLTDYLAKDFWKDHKKMYQNRPIYWLFASKKGAFKALVYLHRMDPYTVGKVRNKYLLPYIEWLKAQIDDLMARQAELGTVERKQLQKCQKQLEECREYDVRLHEAATHPMNIDLDDGVVVNYAKYGDILAKLK